MIGIGFSEECNLRVVLGDALQLWKKSASQMLNQQKIGWPEGHTHTGAVVTLAACLAPTPCRFLPRESELSKPSSPPAAHRLPTPVGSSSLPTALRCPLPSSSQAFTRLQATWTDPITLALAIAPLRMYQIYRLAARAPFAPQPYPRTRPLGAWYPRGPFPHTKLISLDAGPPCLSTRYRANGDFPHSNPRRRQKQQSFPPADEAGARLNLATVPIDFAQIFEGWMVYLISVLQAALSSYLLQLPEIFFFS